MPACGRQSGGLLVPIHHEVADAPKPLWRWREHEDREDHEGKQQPGLAQTPHPCTHIAQRPPRAALHEQRAKGEHRCAPALRAHHDKARRSARSDNVRHKMSKSSLFCQKPLAVQKGHVTEKPAKKQTRRQRSRV